jgi:hypothetical protein
VRRLVQHLEPFGRLSDDVLVVGPGA